MAKIAGSFRDPSGFVFSHDGELYRAVTHVGAAEYDASKSILDSLVASRRMVAFREVAPVEPGAVHTLKLDRLPFVTHPYEWSFALLKTAALFHLDLHLDLLAQGFTLSDASAYNVQFVGIDPVFIDHLSVRRYREGEFWLGHRQFCEQFLLPLLLRAKFDIPHNSWYRGSLEGIPTRDFARLLSGFDKLSPRMLTHVILPDLFDRRAGGDKASSKKALEKRLPLSGLRGMLSQLRNWIDGLEPANRSKTTWANYASEATYDPQERVAKRAFVAEAVKSSGAKKVIDLGCNTGDYSDACLAAGADLVIGFDFDQQSLDKVCSRARDQKLRFTPLYLDARNPAPDQGWMQSEREGIAARLPVGMVVALAFEHHLAIAHNIPLDQVIDWILAFAPRGVIEFVPKSDPTIQTMLALREDIFPDYTQETFEALLGQRRRIVARQQVSSTGRTLYSFSPLDEFKTDK